MFEISPILGATVMGWKDIYLSSLILCVLVFLVYTECMSAGLSKHYVDNYIVTTVIATVGCHLFFLLVHFLTKTKANPGVPFLSFLYLEYQHFFDIGITYLTDFSLLLAIIFLNTLPYIFMYNHYYGQEMRFQNSKILIPSYVKALQILLIYAVIYVLCSTL